MLKVSSIQSDITPQGKYFPCPIHRGKLAEEIKDHCYATSIILQIKDKKLIWVTLDLGGLNKEFSDHLKSLLSEQYQIPQENINLGFTHTHSAPPIHQMMASMKADESYKDYVKEKVLDCVSRAFEHGLKECKAYVSTYTIDGYYSNRIGKEFPSDQNFSLLQFKDTQGKVLAAAYAYACHSTVVGPSNRYVTADLAGAISRGLQEKLGVYPLCMLGAAGDMSNRLYRQGHDYAELLRVQAGIMAQLNIKVKETELSLDELVVEKYRYHDVFHVSHEDRQKQIKEIQHKIDTAPNEDLKRVFTSALLFATNASDQTDFDFDCEGTIIRMNDIMIVTMPAELFNQFGTELKNAMPCLCPIFWGYSNYSVGYLYNQESQGTSFESAATTIPAGTTEKIIAQIKAQL